MKFQEQEIRRDEREQWKKGILKFTEEDPLLLAYSDGYKAGKKEEREKVLERVLELTSRYEGVQFGMDFVIEDLLAELRKGES